jgi:hypothetical protein
LSPTSFASLLQEGKLIQPFAAIMQGPGWHFLLLKPGEARASVRDFRCVHLQVTHSEAAGREPPCSLYKLGIYYDEC